MGRGFAIALACCPVTLSMGLAGCAAVRSMCALAKMYIEGEGVEVSYETATD